MACNPPNPFPGKTQQWLEERLQAINDQIDVGAQTVVSHAPGMRDEFKGKSDADLRRRRDEYLYALFLVAPGTYPNPYAQRTSVTRQAFL